jgi:WD40 repeat protein
LRDIATRETIFQLLVHGLPSEFPPLNTLDVAFRRGMRRASAIAAVILAVVMTLALIAMREVGRANRERHRAEQEAVTARRNFYFASMNLAELDWEANNIGRLRQLLAQTRDSPERGFEWAYWQRLCHLDLFTLRGHTSHVTSVVFSPEGKRIVTGSADNTVKVWDAATRREMLTLRGHSHGVTSVAFSPDGRWIVTGSEDHTARLWDARTGREILPLVGHTGTVQSVAFSPDSRRIVTADDRGRTKVWDTATGREVLTLRGNGLPCVAFAPDGLRIVTGGPNGTATVWEAASAQQIAAWAAAERASGTAMRPPSMARSSGPTGGSWPRVEGTISSGSGM